jgi:hypothetical protein
MRFKILGLAAVAAAQAPAAQAADFLFFSTGGALRMTLVINGVDYAAVDQGWITSQGQHDNANDNYAVSRGGPFAFDYNNWGHFDLANLSGPVTSAELRLNSGGISVATTVTYTLFDTAATYAELDQTRAPGNAGGIALYQDLASGVAYGSRDYTQADNNQVRLVTFNSAGRAAIEAAAGGKFSFGGTLAPLAVGAVPEPQTWALLILGFGLTGAAMRRRSSAVLRVA